MHGEQVRNAGRAGGPGAVTRQREFVAVGDVDAPAAQRRRQSLPEAEGNGAVEAEVLYARARWRELAGEPAFTAGGEEGNDLTPRGDEAGREQCDDALGASRAIAFDELGDAQSAEVVDHAARSSKSGARAWRRQALRRRSVGASPAVHASKADGLMDAGTLTRGSAHGSAPVVTSP